jgi:integrase/recombinase XerD
MKTTTAIIHELRVTNSDDTHPVKLRVTHNRKQKYYTLNVKPDKTGLSKDAWSKVMDEKSRGESKTIRDTLNESEQTAINIIKTLPEFTFEAFEALWYKKQSKVDLIAAIIEHKEKLKKEGKLKTADVYFYAAESIKKFIKKDKILFSSVTPEWLKKYEEFMTAKGRSQTTISMYLRTVRAVFNMNNTENYPFGKQKNKKSEYVLPDSNNVKKALPLHDIAKIYNYQTIDPLLAKSRDLFILSYLCNGMNFKDLALLKYKDIDGDSINFIRSKTLHKKKLRFIIVPLTVEIGRLIDRYGTSPKLPDSYVLPILTSGMTPEQQRRSIDNTVRLVNKHIKKIAKNIGITVNVSTYTARHSFATVLLRAGASMEFASESLGHSSVLVTENYFAGFDMDKKREMAAILTNFDNG